MASAPNSQLDRPAMTEELDQKLPDSAKEESSVLTEPRQRWFRMGDLLAVACFLIAGIYLRGREWLNLDGTIPQAHSGDPQFFEVMFAQAARVVTKFENPFFTDRINVPDGVNLMANTSVLGIGIPLTPITLLFGPHMTFVVVASLSLALTAICWYFVLSRTLVQSRLAAFVGAAIAGFGPGMVAHSAVHLNFAFQFMVPLIMWRTIKLADSPTRRDMIRNAALLAACVVYQVFIGEEVLLFTVLAIGVFIAAYAALNWAEVRPKLATFFSSLGLAAGFAIVVLAYPLWFQFFGPQHYRGLPREVGDWGNDLVANFAPATESAVGAIFGNRAGQLSHHPTEQNSFFGVCLLALVAIATLWLWRWKLARAVAITGFTFGLFALGPELIVNNHKTGIPLPWALLSKLPLIDHIIPTRLTLITLACIGILSALLAEKVLPLTLHIRQWSPKEAAWSIAFAVSLLSIFPSPISVLNRAATPTFISSGQWRNYVRDDRSILLVPLPDAVNSGMRWSAQTHLDMAIPLGYFLGPGPDGETLFGAEPRPTTVLIEQVIRKGKPVTVTTKNRQEAQRDLAYWHADAVALSPHKYEKPLRETLDKLLGPSRFVGGMWVWDVR